METTSPSVLDKGARGRRSARLDSSVPGRTKSRRGTYPAVTKTVECDLSEVFRLLQIRWIAVESTPCSSDAVPSLI